MEIQTNIALTSQESKVYKKFTTLSVNETPLPQGDAVIRISPFDDYFIFTLFDEVNGEDKPIDLSNVGTLYISFIGRNDEIRIPYYTNVQDLNMAQGQVLFRISKDNSKKILELDNDNFYISSKMFSQDGSESDETILYTGKFKALDEEVQESLTSQLENASIEYAKELGTLTTENEKLKQEKTTLNAEIARLNLIIQQLRTSNQNLSNELSNLAENTSQFSDSRRLLEEAAEIQTEKDVKQVISANKAAATKANAKNLERYF